MVFMVPVQLLECVTRATRPANCEAAGLEMQVMQKNNRSTWFPHRDGANANAPNRAPRQLEHAPLAEISAPESWTFMAVFMIKFESRRRDIKERARIPKTFGSSIWFPIGVCSVFGQIMRQYSSLTSIGAETRVRMPLDRKAHP